MTLAAVVTVDTLGQCPDQLLGPDQGLGIVIEDQLVFEGGQKALNHCIAIAALGRQLKLILRASDSRSQAIAWN